MKLTITIPGKPQPQQRMKATIRGQHASVYEPAESRNWKATAQQHMADALRISGAKIFDVALRVEIVAVFPLPAGEHRKKPVRRRWHTKANGDADNLAKAVLDAGNAVLWTDDSLIAELGVRKFVAAQGEQPCVTISVEALEEWPAPEVGPLISTLSRPSKQTTFSGSAAVKARMHQ